MKHTLKFWEDFWEWFLDQAPEMEELYCGECVAAEEFRKDFEAMKQEFEKKMERKRKYISLMDCDECGEPLFLAEEMIIHRKIEGEHHRFHPLCWHKYQSSKDTPS